MKLCYAEMHSVLLNLFVVKFQNCTTKAAMFTVFSLKTWLIWNVCFTWTRFSITFTESVHYLKPKSGRQKISLNVNLPLGLYFRCSSMNWHGHRAEMQWRGGGEDIGFCALPSTQRSRRCRTNSLAQREA